jgi:hypothetical protein
VNWIGLAQDRNKWGVLVNGEIEDSSSSRRLFIRNIYCHDLFVV